MSRLLPVHLDDLTLRLLAVDPSALSDADTGHLSSCPRCQARAGAAHRDAETLRSAAQATADAAFSPADLVRQQRAIAARIARGQRSARVLPFPSHEAITAAPRADRRWLAAAAAAGLVIGALAGQLPRVFDGASAVPGRSAATSTVVSRTEARPLEDTLLSEVDAALDRDGHAGLRALDALTPVHYELR